MYMACGDDSQPTTSLGNTHEVWNANSILKFKEYAHNDKWTQELNISNIFNHAVTPGYGVIHAVKHS